MELALEVKFISTFTNLSWHVHGDERRPIRGSNVKYVFPRCPKAVQLLWILCWRRIGVARNHIRYLHSCLHTLLASESLSPRISKPNLRSNQQRFTHYLKYKSALIDRGLSAERGWSKTKGNWFVFGARDRNESDTSDKQHCSVLRCLPGHCMIFCNDAAVMLKLYPEQ